MLRYKRQCLLLHLLVPYLRRTILSTQYIIEYVRTYGTYDAKNYTVCTGTFVLVLYKHLYSGGLWNSPSEDVMAYAWDYAISKVNDDRSILMRSRLIPVKEDTIMAKASFNTATKSRGEI